ncbi:MAG TPA: thiamine phosphate synthase [Pyrinomonadaceae bacterium]|jgi:thiamine-phosphate pyrophosphorylase|nr:thiamine phosphate synthase [Pyrinomonadaceae bacterium]
MRGRFRLPRVYPITDTQISGLSHAEQVALFAEGGATVVQLREKHAPAREFYEQAKAALKVANNRGVRLIVNDRADIALAIGAAGVHLGQDDLPPEAARRLLGEDAIIGYSTHSLAQIQEAAKLPIDYFAIGPIFSTSTKENPDPVVGLDGARLAREAIGDRLLVGIGGISQTNAAEVIHAGTDAVALIRALLSDSTRIPQTLQALITRLRP